MRYGPLPVDAFVFADAGAGWGGEQRFGPHDSGGRFVRSLGVGVRANVFGLIVEATAARPFDLRRTGGRSGWICGRVLTLRLPRAGEPEAVFRRKLRSPVPDRRFDG